MNKRLAAALLLWGAAWIGGAAEAAEFSYQGGLTMWTGAYMYTTSTTTWILDTGITMRAGRVTTQAILPILRQDTQLITSTGAGPIPSGGPMSEVVADSGMGRRSVPARSSGHHGPIPVPEDLASGYELLVGDPIGRVDWEILANTNTVVAIGGLVKAPVADAPEYGTGAWDVGATLSSSRSLGYEWLVSLGVSYWHLGDSPDFDFQDPVGGNVGLSRRAGDWVIGVSASAASTSLSGYDGPVMIGTSLLRPGSGSSWGIQASVGLTETAPDFTAGATWRFPFGRRM